MSKEKQRLLSLDILRGMTVFGMIIVNNGGGPLNYDTLSHSAWNGMTPCDLVFPFFLFIMGISTFIALRKFNFEPSRAVVGKILKRTVLIYLVGIGIDLFAAFCKGDFLPFDHLRLTGVLHRIALCYCAVSLCALYIRHSRLIWVIGGLLMGYTAFLLLGNGYANDSTNLLAVIDRQVLGAEHLYKRTPIDPEGLFSTISSIAHTLIGFLCGSILLKRDEEMQTKTLRLFVVGFLLMAAGFFFVEFLPLNKRIWSPTYALTSCGLAAMLQATLLYFIDLKGKKQWCRFFEIFGVNPLFLYVLSDVVAIVLGVTHGKALLYDGLHALISNPYAASATFAVLFALTMGLCGYPLYKKKIYIKL